MRAPLAVLAATVTLLGACGGDSGGSSEDAAVTKLTAGEIAVQVASYDLVAGSPRVIVGLVEQGTGRIVSFGSAELRFAWFGEQPQSQASSTLSEPVTANWIPIPGQPEATDRDPEVVRPSEGVGVYEVKAAPLDRPGVWGVSAKVRLAGEDVEAKTTLQVSATPEAAAVGSVAPLVRHPAATSMDVPAPAIDSRATTHDDIPDRGLHAEQLSDIVASGRPAVVVISTPVYCVSRFCGPVTDVVEDLAAEHGDRVGFVHLEVWRDFEEKTVNEAVFPWVNPTRGDVHEPWVFLVDENGRVARRWDNVVPERELRTAVAGLV